MIEAKVQQLVRLEAAKQGVILWRNNVGALPSENGRIIRYGLANDSGKVNRVLKSSDLIGITPVVIEPRHLGRKMGLFTAIETKASDWEWTHTDREQAQLNFLQLVVANGGIGQFSTGRFNVDNSR